MRVRFLKTVLWFLLGTGLTVILLRIINGPGAVVALTDMIPWGLWKGGGVVALVPIGGAGFTLAAFVYVFHWTRYKPLALGAVLVGLMCYTSVAIGLTFDIGIWWRIVFPVVLWQPHSTLFEIAWCIMLYLGVLVIEFSHVVFKKYRAEKAQKFLSKFSIAFVIAGIALSTLHQSSLGTLFLATPYRLHPLWHTDLLPVLFFITSVGLGCLTISWVTLMTYKLYKTEPPMKALSGLGRIAGYVLIFYLLLKFAEIVLSGESSLLVATTWDTANFWLEVLLSALIPGVLLLIKRYRQSPTAIAWISFCAIVGVSLNRINVAGLATVSTTHQAYFPAWSEWAVTIGILAAAALVFLACVEHFRVFGDIDNKAIAAAYAPGKLDHALWSTIFFQNPNSDFKVYSVFFVLAVGIAMGLVPNDAIWGVQPETTPTQGPRVIDQASTGDTPAENGESAEASAAKSNPLLAIDGNRNGDMVLFDHEMHIGELGDRETSTCQSCHHMSKPKETVSKCSDCHSDMYLSKDIFDHNTHVAKMDGNKSCVQCHTDPNAAKVRKNTTACVTCHKPMRHQDALVEIDEEKQSSMAPGYMQSMHKLCLNCHENTCTDCHSKKLRSGDRSRFAGR